MGGWRRQPHLIRFQTSGQTNPVPFGLCEWRGYNRYRSLLWCICLPLRVSVIATVLNEGEAIHRLMDSLLEQTRLPDEVVIVDGGSTDATVRIIKEYEQNRAQCAVRVLIAPGANISHGRNAAIQAASGDIIAVTDAGVRLIPTWLAKLIAPFDLGTSADVQVVSGFFSADAHSLFEIAMGATVLPDVLDINPSRFLPSSRSVAFRKTAWAAVGGYPEWLDYCEDLIFDLRLADEVGSFVWAPEALVYFRPRGTWRSFFKQYYRYARGDGKADLWRLRHAVRYGTYAVALPALLVLTVLHSPLWLLGLLAGVAAYCRTPFRRLWSQLTGRSWQQMLSLLLLVPCIRVVGDLAKICGYPVGWVWRLRHWHDPQVHWRNH